MGDEKTGCGGEWDCVVTTTLKWKKLVDPRELWLNDYVILGDLGKGSFSQVRLCERRVGEAPYRKFALKMMSKNKLRSMSEYVNKGGRLRKVSAEEKIRREIEIMRHLYHRNVVILFEILDDISEESEDPHLCLVVEHMARGPSMVLSEDDECSKFVAPSQPNGVWDEEQARLLFRDLCEGLTYLHQEKMIAHRDIKPDNLMIHYNGTLRIGDFGCAVQFTAPEAEKGGLVHDTAGALAFQPPESLLGDRMGGYGAFMADIWAAGVTLYAWIFGYLPFIANDTESLFEAIRSQSVDLGEAISTSARLQLLGALEKDPDLRSSTKACLESEWLANLPAPEKAEL